MRESTSTLFQKLRQPESASDLPAWEDTVPTCAQALGELLEQAGMSPSQWIAAANISKSYGYQILRGERSPGRDILLRTALCLQLPLKETQRLLSVGGCGQLYPRVRRDAAVVFALNQGLSLWETEELLASLPERSLYTGEL